MACPPLEPKTGNTEHCKEGTTLDKDLPGRPGQDPTAVIPESTADDPCRATSFSALDCSPSEQEEFWGLTGICTGEDMPLAEGPGCSLSLLCLCQLGLACLAVTVTGCDGVPGRSSRLVMTRHATPHPLSRHSWRYA